MPVQFPSFTVAVLSVEVSVGTTSLDHYLAYYLSCLVINAKAETNSVPTYA